MLYFVKLNLLNFDVREFKKFDILIDGIVYI